MGEHERDWEGSPESKDDPPTERGPTESAAAEEKDEDYLRPHLPRDVFGSQIGPVLEVEAVQTEAEPELALDDAEEEPASQPPTDPDPTPSSVFQTRDLPQPDARTRQQIESAIVGLQRVRPARPDPGESAPDTLYSPPPTVPVPPLLPPDGETWTEWRPSVALGHDVVEPAPHEGEAEPSRGLAQPRSTDYLVLHPFPLRTVACLLNLALVVASPWIAATLLSEQVYHPALDVVAEVWFWPFAVAPAAAAGVLALWIMIVRRRHWRYELVYMLLAGMLAGVAITGAVLAMYEDPSARGRYLLLVWGGLLSLLPLLFSLHVNMDPAWVVGRRRYWSGVMLAFAPTLLSVGVLAAAVGAVHDAHREWRRFIDPQDDAFCQNLFDADGFRPGTLAMVVLGRRRDSRLAGRAATCVRSLINRPWTKNKAGRSVALSKSAVQSTADTLSAPWRASQRNLMLNQEWSTRRTMLQTMSDYVAGLTDTTQSDYKDRLRSKGPSRVACANPFREAESALWRMAGHPDCGRPLSRADRIKHAVTWLRFLGRQEAFTDPRLNDLRSEEARDLRVLLNEVSHTLDGKETRTQDVTLIAPSGGKLDRFMIVRAAPEEEGQKLYLIAYPSQPLGIELLRIIRDEWGTGSRLRCKLRPEYRNGPGYYRIYALKDREDGYVIVRKWVRGKQRREYYQIMLSRNPC